MTEIFDPERARRLTLLRQSTAPNVIKINPDTASFLRRYEDADVSRLKLLEAQRLRQEGEAEKQLIKLQKQRLKKRLRGKGKGLPKGRGSRGGRAPPPQKSALEVEIEREKQLEDIRKQKKKEEVEEERFAAERIDARLERGRLERSTRQEARLADDRLFFEGFQRAQDRTQLQNIADREAQQRILDRGQLLEIEDRRELLAIADRRASRQRLEQELGVRRGELAAGRAERAEREQIRDRERQERLEDRQEQARLQDQREEIQGRQIAAAQESNREIQAQQLRLIEEDRGRYDREVRSLQTQREQDIARIEAERAGVAERVARDDAFRHAQLQEQQKLALENLAKQQRDNTALHELEQNRIDNQRAVDAERAITDRELIQGFTSAIQTLNTQRDQDPLRLGPTTGESSVQEVAATVREGLATGVGAELQQPQPEPQLGGSTTSSDSPFDRGSVSDLEGISQTGSELAADTQRASREAGLRPELETPTPRIGQASEVDVLKRIQDAPEDTTPRKTVAERQPLSLEEQSGSSVSSSSSEEGLDQATQRTLSIMSNRGAPETRQRQRQEERGLTPTGRLGEKSGFPVLGQTKVVRARETSPTIGTEALADSPRPTVEFQVGELTKSQVERDLPFVGPKPTGDLRAPETLETPIGRQQEFEQDLPFAAAASAQTPEQIEQAERDLELFGKSPFGE